MKFLCAISLVYFVLAGASVQAQDYKVGKVEQQAFIVTVTERLAYGTVGGVFCREQGGSFEACSGFNKGAGHFEPSLGALWNKNKRTQKYAVLVTHGRFRGAPGRYYMASGNRISVGNATYYADLAPGTAVVFGKGVPAAEAISFAKTVMLKEMGDRTKSLKFISGGAVSVSCAKAGRMKSCKIGKKISVDSVSFR